MVKKILTYYNVGKLSEKDVMIINKKNKYYEKNSRKILANNIVYFRIKNNWSQEDFADVLGTTPTYISNLENAKRNTRIDFIGRIADVFEITIDELFIERTIIQNNRISRR